MGRRKIPIPDRFWPKVLKTKTCWLWVGSTFPGSGYGQFSLTHDQPTNAHRVAFLLVKGEIPEGRYVLHKCDNRLCVRPSHLFLGTSRDNTRDMLAKGRNPALSFKLNDRDVKEIRRLHQKGVSNKRIANKVSVDPSHISKIVNGHTRLPAVLVPRRARTNWADVVERKRR